MKFLEDHSTLEIWVTETYFCQNFTVTAIINLITLGVKIYLLWHWEEVISPIKTLLIKALLYKEKSNNEQMES